jgi:hypothetical protein
MNFKQDVLAVADALQQQHIQSAVCGAVALAIHGFVRATPGIDILVPADAIEAAIDVAVGRGFQKSDEKRPPVIAVVSMSKGNDSERTTLHFLEVTPMTQSAWDSRQWFDIDDQRCCVVARDGLIYMKQSSGRRSDDVDIQRLIDPASHDPFLPENPAPPLMTARAIGDRLEMQSQLLALCLMLGDAKFTVR